MSEEAQNKWHALPPAERPPLSSPERDANAEFELKPESEPGLKPEPESRSTQAKRIHEQRVSTRALAMNVAFVQVLLIAVWVPFLVEGYGDFLAFYAVMMAALFGGFALGEARIRGGRIGWIRSDFVVEFDDGQAGRAEDGPTLVHAVLRPGREHRNGTYREDGDSTRYRGTALGPLLQSMRACLQVAVVLSVAAVILTVSAYALSPFVVKVGQTVCEVGGPHTR